MIHVAIRIPTLPEPRRITRETFARRARAISTEKHFRFNMGDVVTHGYLHPERDDSLGRVLTDDAPPE